MTAARTTIAGFALLIAAASQARAQQRAPRWGGERTASANSASGQASGGSWDGRRTDYGGSPPARRERQGMDLSSFFGYVPPRGQTAQNVPVQPAVRLVQLPAEQSVVGSAAGSASQSSMQLSTQSATQWDLQYSAQPVAQSGDQPVVRRGGHSPVEAPKTDVPQHRTRITWP